MLRYGLTGGVIILLTLVLLCSKAAFASQMQLGQWQVGVNLGYGKVTNPLYGGDDLNLYVIPDVAYYTDTWYLDNTQLGYTFVDSSNHVLSAIFEINPHARYFVKWHPSNIFALQSSALAVESQSPKYIDINDLDTRRWALDGGFEYHYFSDFGQISLTMVADVSDVYRGQRAQLGWRKTVSLNSWLIEPSFGVQYSSNELNTYYYGFSELEALELGKQTLGSSVHPYVKIDISYLLTQHTALRLHFHYVDFNSLAKQSLLFESEQSVTAFLGVKYVY
ncbi:MipA/OmpV family protein [Pseudoalteromonas sp. SSDWG2]|uniref:MipA/OmpV family protein n=1 Tax=Pseudoalteromonas sp. SSDWG2 TaxID=3139391 RepID=UPI003BAC3D48